MKSFKKFLFEKSDTGLIIDTGLSTSRSTYGDQGSPLETSVPAATQTNQSNKAFNPRSSLGFLLPAGLDKTALADIAYQQGLISDPNTNLNTTQLNNLIGSNNQKNQSFMAMASTIPFQNVGVDGNTVQQIAQYLSVNGFMLDEKYDAILKIYMEMEKAKNQGKEVSPWIAANKLVAQKTAQQNLKKIGALNDLESGSFKIPDFDPLDDLISTGVYDKPQQPMGGMGGIPLETDIGE